MELERRDQPVPRIGVVDAGEGGVERRRRGEAVAADLDARRHLQGAAPAARHDRREARAAVGADAAEAPAFAGGAQARPAPPRRGDAPAAQGAKRAGRRHRLNILPAMDAQRSRGRAPPRCGRGRAGAATDGGTARAALAAPRGGPSPGRAPGADAGRARARARLGRRSRRRPRRRCGSAIRRPRSSPSSRMRRGWHAPARSSERRWWSLGRRARGAGPCRRPSPMPRSAAPSSSGPTWCCTASPIRRRCSRAGTSCSRSMASSPSPASARARSRELRELYATLGWPAPTPGFIDMHDLGDMLVAAGFADPVLDQETLTLSWASAEALLARAAPARRQRRARSLRRPAHAGVATPPGRGARGARRRRWPDLARASRSPTATDSRPAPRASRRRRRGLARRHARDGEATPPTR